MKHKLLTVITGLALFVSMGAYSFRNTSSAAADDSVYYAQTGHSVSGVFNRYLQNHGGIQIIGLPISAEVNENGYAVQYFERERLEYHPEHAGTSYEVLLGLLAVQLTQGRSFPQATQTSSTADTTYFAETHHTVSPLFNSYWSNNGGLSMFGYPISEVLSENGYQVQYFQRARFEEHPEHAGTIYEVQLGLLGVQYLQQHPVSSAPVVNNSNNNGLNSYETQILADVNSGRAAAGLGAVTLDNSLITIARSRSNDMATRNYFSHYTPEGHTFLDTLNSENYPYSFAGETIARNNYDTTQTTQVAWNAFMNSSAHKAIIMDGRFTKVGVGFATDANGMHYFTMIFAQP